MPGIRLTHQERRRIEQGVADGLAYAEIARGLERPTSTVTREVTRNGGAASYRADLAHRASAQRARRRRKAVPRTPEAVRSGQERDSEALREYEEMFAAVFIQQGLSRMTARVLVCIYTTDTGSLTAAELVRRLQVSPASVSKAVAFLEEMGLLRRERDERRRDRYIVDNDVWYQSTLASAKGEALVAETARKGVHILGPGTPAAIRLENIARFVEFISEGIVRAAEQAREVLHIEPGTGGIGGIGGSSGPDLDRG